jgi:ABC-type phosphate transport system permease subunit
MKKSTVIILCVCIAVVAILGTIAAIFIFRKEEKNMTIKCMSFNILGVEGYEGYLPNRR